MVGLKQIPVTVLGVDWSPAIDVVSFIASISFAQNKRGVHQFPDLMIDQTTLNMPHRMVYEHTMQIYDPFGILSEFTLAIKLIRQTWISDF